MGPASGSKSPSVAGVGDHDSRRTSGSFSITKAHVTHVGTFEGRDIIDHIFGEYLHNIRMYARWREGVIFCVYLQRDLSNVESETL